MKKLITLLLLALLISPTFAQDEIDMKVEFSRRNMDGPRLGVTYVPPNSLTGKSLAEHDVGALISQFGWHFEYQVVPKGYGPSFLIELIPLVGGVEYGTLIPSITLAMGIRMPSGIEFGIGPNVVMAEQDKTFKASTALVIAAGKSFDYSGVSIPINLVVATSRAGQRYSIMVGYAID
jgi:hypothetical protein